MTINKSQGQSLKNVGIYLPTPLFSLGQLYVTLLRAKSSIGLKVFILDNDIKTKKTTTNVVFVVFVEAFQNVGLYPGELNNYTCIFTKYLDCNAKETKRLHA